MTAIRGKITCPAGNSRAPDERREDHVPVTNSTIENARGQFSSEVIRPFDAGRWFSVSNVVFDHIMPTLKPNAWKVLCVAIRQTWGWVADPSNPDPEKRKERKAWDVISYSQFLEKSGIGSRSTLHKAIKECLDKGYLVRVEVSKRAGIRKPDYAYRLNTAFELVIEHGMEIVLENPGTETVPDSSTVSVPESGTVSGLTKEKRQGNKGDVVSTAEQESVQLLLAFGISPSVVGELAKDLTPTQVEEAIRKAKGKNDPQAYLVAMIRNGWQPRKPKRPKTEAEKRAERHAKYRDGEYSHIYQGGSDIT